MDEEDAELLAMTLVATGVLCPITRMPRPRCYSADYFASVLAKNDADFYDVMRLPRAVFNRILERIRPSIETVRSRLKNSTISLTWSRLGTLVSKPAETQLLCFLQYVNRDGSYIGVSNMFSMSNSTAFASVCLFGQQCLRFDACTR
jgi:hypothetical protein